VIRSRRRLIPRTKRPQMWYRSPSRRHGHSTVPSLSPLENNRTFYLDTASESIKSAVSGFNNVAIFDLRSIILRENSHYDGHSDEYPPVFIRDHRFPPINHRCMVESLLVTASERFFNSASAFCSSSLAKSQLGGSLMNPVI
jgi:hypothetical protein